MNGSLDTPPDIPDVDFLEFAGTPDSFLRVDLEGAATGDGTLADPLLGLFDSNCNLIAVNDDSGGTNSRLLFTVPADGIFVLAAAAFPDFSFTGAGGSSGTYQLTIAAAPAFIGSISGRTVDAVTGDPLPGDVPPFAAAVLLRCEEVGCFELNSAQVDSEGRFQFQHRLHQSAFGSRNLSGLGVRGPISTRPDDPFEVGEGEDRDVGDIPLQPFPVQFSEIHPCEDLSLQGGICSYSVKVANRTATKLDGAIWTIVTAGGIRSRIDFTVFQTANPRKVKLSSMASRVVRFDFAVPDTVRDGAFICADVFIGEDRAEPFFNTIGARNLFCITKGSAGFAMVAENQAQKFRQQFDVRSLIPPK